MLKRLKSFWVRLVYGDKTPAKYKAKRLTYSFTHAGIRYYGYENINEAPVMRVFTLLAIYEQAKMHMTYEDLLEYSKLTLEALGSANLEAAFAIQRKIVNQLNFKAEEESILRLASCVFVEEGEPLEKYDEVINMRKIARWKKGGIKDFFLQLPLETFSIVSSLSTTDMIQYFETTAKSQIGELENLIEIMSQNGNEKQELQFLKRKVQDLRERIS